MNQPKQYPTVADVHVTQPRGPWRTKSGSQLTELVAHPHDAGQHILDDDGSPFANAFATATSFLTYDAEEIRRLPHDIRGLRIYLNDQMPKGGIGGKEFHRIRQEFIIGIAGCVLWTSEDVYGGVVKHDITPGVGVFIPPWILHTYEAVREGSGLLVLYNTLYTQRSHDTYPITEFRDLQAQIRDAATPVP